MPPPIGEVQRSNGQKVSTLTAPTAPGFGPAGRPVSVDDVNWRHTLTINILLDQMNVQNAPRQFVRPPYRFGRIMDRNRRWFLVRDWRPVEWTSFLADFESVSERFWNRRFMLIPPAGYDGMDRPQPNPTHRPNAITHLDLNIRPRTGMRAYPIELGWWPVSIWKLATRLDLPGSSVRLPSTMAAAARDIGRRSFRSSASNMVRADAYSDRGRTVIHEVGHLNGQRHPGEWQGVQIPGCGGPDPSEHACYVGTRPEHRDNIMGLGRDILPENADPWRDLIAEHTSTREADWGVYVMDSGQPMPQPTALTTLTASRPGVTTP